MNFPNDFAWGVAAASYQIEGGVNDDGRGPSVWDMMCRKEGATHQKQTGDVACDHYHRYAEDVALWKSLNFKAYRMSISWSRVIPDGVGAVNPKGIEFYDKLIDALLAAGITPYVTLFHWDYPLALYFRGGWLNPQSPRWFEQYTQVIVDKFSDRVKHWMTLNEPQCFVGLGHGDAYHAPGLKLSLGDQVRIAHHALVSHGKAVQTIRARSKSKSTIGFAPVGVLKYPATTDPKDIEAARKSTMSAGPNVIWSNTWYSDPIFFGHYPEDGLKLVGAKDAPPIQPGDLETIRQPLDFYGVNIYHAPSVKADEKGEAKETVRPPGFPRTAFDWPVEPASLYWGPRFIFERYKVPVIVTENGMSSVDVISTDGNCHDPQRIDFTRRYLQELRRAMQDGVDVRGYFHWTVMDNFEWAEGFRQRFGLIHCDYTTLKRTPKDSAYWYRDLIASNGANLDR